MSTNFQPTLTTGTYTMDKLLGADMPMQTRSITIEARADTVDADFVRGRLLHLDVDGKAHFLSSTETTVALNTTGEVIGNNLQAASGTAPIPFVLAHPPIPGTVTLATTADGSATPILALGTDNGHGVGVGAGGRFIIDYQTGQGVAYPASAATNGDDLKAGYKYRAIDAADAGETLTGLPNAILAEDVPGASVVAGDVVSIAYIAGEFRRAALLGYSAGYEPHLNAMGIYTK